MGGVVDFRTIGVCAMMVIYIVFPKAGIEDEGIVKEVQVGRLSMLLLVEDGLRHKLYVLGLKSLLLPQQAIHRLFLLQIWFFSGIVPADFDEIVYHQLLHIV